MQWRHLISKAANIIAEQKKQNTAVDHFAMRVGFQRHVQRAGRSASEAKAEPRVMENRWERNLASSQAINYPRRNILKKPDLPYRPLSR
ncbi:hypothetical protein ACNKHW_11420 [Shigella flexneri]